MRSGALALWCALLALGAAAAYTIDCNHEYTDCDTELSKIAVEDEDEQPTVKRSTTTVRTNPTTTSVPRRTTTEQITSTTEAIRPEEIKPTTEAIDLTPEPEVSDSDAGNNNEQQKPNPRMTLNVDELQNFANALHNQTNAEKKKSLDLSDVTLDDDEEEHRVIEHPAKNIPDKFFSTLNGPYQPERSEEETTCKENDVSFKVGEKIDRGCEETCECTAGGIFDCTPRCKHPYIRRGRRLNDPLCFESPVDLCCSIMACTAGQGDSKPVQMCRYGNESHPTGSKWYIGCDQKCSCEPNSIVTCQPRCQTLRPSEKCINVQDPSDACCEIQVCDVSQDAHETVVDNTTSTTPASVGRNAYISTQDTNEAKTSSKIVVIEPIESVKILKNKTVQVNLPHANTTGPVHLLLSKDGGKTFKEADVTHSNLILNLESGKDYILKTEETGTRFNFSTPEDWSTQGEPAIKRGCWENKKFYEIGAEFHIGCSELCECTGHNQKECAALVCPNHVGLELMSKGCVRWAPSPPAQPPNCCPRSARCLSDGTCYYNGEPVPNWTEVPITLTGCEQRCFCENGELDCQEVCSPLPPVPPQSMRCPPMHRPAPVNISDEDCCKQWGCVPSDSRSPDFIHKTQAPFLPTIPPDMRYPEDEIPGYDQNNIHRPDDIPGISPGIQTSFGDMNKKLSVISVESDSPNSVTMLLGLPSVLVGLRGSVDLRYTDTADEDVSHWYSQVFAPADEILTTPRLEFRLTGLKPSTTYKIRGKLFLHNLPVAPTSDIYSVRTQDDSVTVQIPPEEKRREINSRFSVVSKNDTTAQVSWRHFTEDELQYIDGVQIRYRPVGTPIYSMTELLHHSRSGAELVNLRPGTRYEASLVLVPPPRVTTELNDPQQVEFNTAPYIDPYNWSVTIDVRSVGAEAADLVWSGVPSPAERWVRVYRAAHACGDQPGKEQDEFKLATRDQPPSVTLIGLEANSRCRVWLELFLTNGKVKTSNVLEINTKALDSDNTIDNEISASSISSGSGSHRSRGDYYSALVGVGVVAALGALTSLLLLLVVVRRHRPRTANITPVPSAPRESSLPPYDNPAYKLELQQETMDL